MPEIVKRIRRSLGTDALVRPMLGSVARSVVAAAVGVSNDRDTHIERTSEVMWEKISLMPKFLGYPMMGATLAFDLYGIAVGGRPFHLLGPEARQRQIHQWRTAPIAFCQDFLDFYEKMGTFVYYTERYGEGEESGEAAEPGQQPSAPVR